MKKLKPISFILSLSLLTCLIMPAHAVEPPQTEAKAAILMNAESGEIYFSKGADTPLPPASTTKIMTALLAFEAIDRGEISLQDMVTASNTSHNDLTLDGSSQGIVPGETMSLENLLYCALVAAANEACNIIGEYIVGGNISDFISLMNSRAESLGCKNTHFSNAHGLPTENHYSSAHDLALISAEAMKYAKFVEIVNTVTIELPPTNMHEARFMRNANELINPNRAAYYSEASGIRTGSTNDAGNCLVSSVSIEGIRVISVVLGCGSKELEDGSFENLSFSETKNLMRWLANNYTAHTMLSTTELICEVPVTLAEGTNIVVARPESDMNMLIPKDYDVNTIEKKPLIFSEQEGAEPLSAPISAGDIIGEIRISYNGAEYGPIPLVANTSVSLSKLEYIKNQIKSTLGKTWVKLAIAAFVLIIVIYLIIIIRYNTIRRKRRRAAYEAAKRKASSSKKFK